LILPEVIRLFQGLSHAYARHTLQDRLASAFLEKESVDGSLLRLL